MSLVAPTTTQGSQTDPSPLVSVVIPCLNRVKYLASTIESVLQQDYKPIECIVVDGGSTDGTVDVLRSYGDRIRYVSEPDKGHADAINKGWWMSRGEILAWLNADDCYVVPHAVRTAASYLDAHPEIDIAYGDCGIMAEDGAREDDVRRSRQWDLEYALRFCAYTIPQPAAFIRRGILERVGWLDPTYHLGKDHELWLRVGLVGKMQHVPCLLAYGRAIPGLSQEAGVGKSKIRITEEFLRRGDLPESLATDAFKRRALSNAYLVAAEYSWEGGHRKLFWKYAWQSVQKDSRNSPYISWRLLVLLGRSIIPLGWRRFIRHSLKRARVIQQ